MCINLNLFAAAPLLNQVILALATKKQLRLDHCYIAHQN
jgi:hypothetical protein